MSQANTPLPPVPMYAKAEPTPLSRPLVYFAICLFLNAASVLYELKGYFQFMGTFAWNQAIDSRGSAPNYIPIMEPLLYVELFVKSAALLVALALLILLARRSWFFIKGVLAYLSASLFIRVIEIAASVYLDGAFTAKHLGDPPLLGVPDLGYLFSILGIREIGSRWGFFVVFGWVLVTLIWLAYFIFSERVRETFVE